MLRDFASAVLAIEPAATGTPVMFQEAARIIVHAFIEATALALVSIAIILLIALRRIGDVLLTLVPLIVAGLVTLEICGLIGLQLNFANIIALPLLLGVGVAFKIYYIVAWRSGKTNFLEINIDPCRDLQRHDHRNGIRQPVAVQRTGCIQHGQAVGAIACVYTLGGCAVSTNSYGATASEGKPRWEQSTRLKW